MEIKTIVVDCNGSLLSVVKEIAEKMGLTHGQSVNEAKGHEIILQQANYLIPILEEKIISETNIKNDKNE